MKTIFRADLTIYDGCDDGWLYVDKHRNGYDVTASDYLDNVLSPADALALANALLDDLGLGWLAYPENKPVEFGMYEVTLSEGIYRVRTDLWDGDIWTLKNVIAFRKTRPYESEVE
jgi:hypothetical protein